MFQAVAIWQEPQSLLERMSDRLSAGPHTSSAGETLQKISDKLEKVISRLDDISKKLIDAQVATNEVRSRQLGENHPDYIAAAQREAALTQSLAAQRRLVLQLKGRRDELNQLTAEADAEQQNYTATIQNYQKQSFQSQFTQTNIAVLSPAVAPSDPTSPNVALNMVSAAVLGVILGLSAALVAEMIDPKVRLRRD